MQNLNCERSLSGFTYWDKKKKKKDELESDQDQKVWNMDYETPARDYKGYIYSNTFLPTTPG